MKQFIQDAKNKYAQKNTTIPELRLRENERYVAGKLKNPFTPFRQDKRKIVNQTNPLLNYPIESLNLVGVLGKEKKYWAAIMTPNGQVLEVGVGMNNGQNKAKIVSITPERVTLRESRRIGSKTRTRKIVLKITTG